MYILQRYICTLFSLFLAFTNSISGQEIPLYPNGILGSSKNNESEKVRLFENREHIITNIHNPSILPYLPTKDANTGIAVIIAPGGGHRELWIDHEGYNVAKILQDNGIAAFVLKYRLAKDSMSTYTIDGEELDDMQSAIKLVKSQAVKWNIDPEKIGVMGFSAGGEVAALSAMRFKDGNPNADNSADRHSSRPAFQALIYPGNSERFEVVENAPPLFILGGFNDRADIAEGLARVYLKYKQANVPAELHIYSNAGHGFGIRPKNAGPSSLWLNRFIEWLNDLYPQKEKK